MERPLSLPDRDPLTVVILGPTASGKTALSLAIARHFPSEIVNCDSVAMVREFEIGTAKPTAAERAEVPHHLFDCVDPSHYITAGEYSRQARQVLVAIKARGRLPIITGGTGLYLRALLEGLFPGPQRSDELRERLRQRSPEHLHRILRRLDPTAAERIHSNDVSKVIRAIEVCLAARQPMSELLEQGREPLRGFSIVRIGLNPDRAALYSRIDARAQQMFSAGLIDETRNLIARYGEGIPPLKSLGYKQAGQFLRGELDREAAIRAAQQAHRNYAKRQMTWFRREPDVHWLTGFGDDPAIQNTAVDLIQRSGSRG